MKELKISIVTPNYNYGNFISETIQSVINQDYKNYEYIIVDDGSTDNSIEVIQNYVDKYPDKVKLIQQENSGQTNAINRALKITTGEIIGWINSDDFYCDNVFGFVNDYFMANPETDVIFSDLRKVDQSSTLISTKKYLDFDFKAGCLIGFGNLIANNTAFFRATVLKRVGYLDESLEYVMDSEFWFRVGKCCKVKKVNKLIGNFRVHSLAKSKQPQQFIIEEQELRKIYYEELIISKFLPFYLGKHLKYIYLIKRKISKYLDRTSYET